MNIAVLGTGIVAQTLASALATRGHAVAIGTRDPAATLARTAKGSFGQPGMSEWAAAHPAVRVATFADAAAGAEVVVNATSGSASLAALTAAGAANLDGKIVLDISNPLDFSKGFPPSLSVANTDSLGEQIQRAFPGARVVKTLNTVSAHLMVDPNQLADGAHDMFVCGDDPGAREQVAGWLQAWFGWTHIVDLGDITNARGTEAYLLLWTRLYGRLGTATFNVHVVR
ncbi:MAG: NAD(P)-binding domain-containing protein [Pseudomonadota bacterium]|nr:NAD(P)-binding domain-containing protein [Pseudomonadota bacterium]